MPDIYIALRRIQTYLELAEINNEKVIIKNGRDDEYAIQINNQNFTWGLKTVDVDQMFDKLYDEVYGNSKNTK